MSEINYDPWEVPEEEENEETADPWKLLDTVLDSLPAFTGEDIRIRSRTITKLNKLKLLLKLFVSGKGLIEAAQAVGYKDLTMVYKERDANPKFAEALRMAHEIRGDFWEGVAEERAKGFTEKTITQGPNGVEIKTKNRYDSSILKMLLKGAKPDKYAERNQTTVDVNHKVGIAIITATPNLSMEEWAKMSKATHAAQKMITLEPENIVDVSKDRVQNVPISRE